eukprot:TRINITY_DN21699_c0_g2_i1.p1 TRINITY_DN21699_c0_g2~~TRINITY_DN21699_c0_g2_i1.p1  ORF type:complete len:218 (+),score=17.44 TRINITY_DN21699_c0_g2_i1:65-718(+)
MYRRFPLIRRWVSPAAARCGLPVRRVLSPVVAFTVGSGLCWILVCLPHSASCFSTGSSKLSEDPFGLHRYTDAQRESFKQALSEIEGGRKTSHWIWYVVPTPPYMVNGIERGSQINQFYAVRSDEEGAAYLGFQANGVHLGENYVQIMKAILAQLGAGVDGVTLMGSLDAAKLHSSVTFFGRVASEARKTDSSAPSVATEVADVCNAILSRLKREDL